MGKQIEREIEKRKDMYSIIEGIGKESLVYLMKGKKKNVYGKDIEKDRDKEKTCIHS